MEEEWKHSYHLIKEKHDEAYYAVDLAIKLEEDDKPEQALAEYKLGIALIDEALSTPVALPDNDDTLDSSWTHALKMIQKMKRSRAEILLRVGTLTTKLYPKDEVPPTVNFDDLDETAAVEGRPRTFSELADALKNLKFDADQMPNSLELLFLCDGVKLYHVAATGVVTTNDESSTLRIVRLEADKAQNVQATYFMQIIRSSVAEPIVEISDEENESNRDVDGATGTSSEAVLLPQKTSTESSSHDNSLIYPLIAGASPCFLTEFGAFLFPDLESSVPGSAIGLVIPDESAEIVLEILEAILHGVVKQGKQPASLSEWEDIPEDQHRPRRALSEQISTGIIRGASHLSNGLVRGSEKVGEMMTYSTPYILARLSRAPENTPPVSDKVVGGVELAKSATNVAVNVTGYVANKVGSATMALGRFLAPHVQCQGSKLLSKTGMAPEKAVETMDGVLTIAAGAVEGFGTVYSGLEQSAGILGTNLSNNSVKLIEHKYGPSAGNVASETFDTVGNLINVNRNMRLLKPRGLVTRTVKNTGKALVADYKPGVTTKKTNYVPAGDLYPDLSEFTKSLSKSKNQTLD